MAVAVERLEQKIGLATFDRSSASAASVGWAFDGKTSDKKTVEHDMLHPIIYSFFFLV